MKWWDNLSRENKLIVVFLAMVVVGLLNSVFRVLVLVPFKNYALFSGIFTTFIYIPVSFSFVAWEKSKGEKSAVTPEMEAFPKWRIAVLGALDSLAGILQVIGVAYSANGSVATLCLQAAPAVSIIITKIVIPKTQYRISQYVGALVVTIGIVIVLLPNILKPTEAPKAQGLSPTVAAIIIIVSCIPMCLSSVLKEVLLGDKEMELWFLNGWVAVFQFLFSIVVLLYPSAILEGVPAKDVWENLWGGVRCLVGLNTVSTDHCTLSGPLLMAAYCLCNVLFNYYILVLLAVGSANIFFLALALTVPLATLTFTIPIVPAHAHINAELFIGLVIICAGLTTYRFYPRIAKAMGLTGRWLDPLPKDDEEEDDDEHKKLGDQDGLAVDDSFLNSNSPMKGLTPMLGTAGRHTRQTSNNEGLDAPLLEPEL